MSEPRLVALGREVDPAVIDSDVLSQVQREPGIYWDEPDDGRLYAGFGSAWEFVASPGPDRIRDAAAAARGLYDTLETLGEAPPPRLAAGMTFRRVRWCYLASATSSGTAGRGSRWWAPA